MAHRSDLLLEALDDRTRAALDGDGDLGSWLDGAIDAARAAWPEVALPEDVFLAYLAAKICALPVPDDYRHLHTTDLALVCACLGHCPHAIASFVRRFGTAMACVMAQAGVSGAEADDLAGVLREKLFFGSNPRIAKYSGRGALSAWLRTVARNAAVNRRATDRRHVDLEEILQMADAGLCPESTYLRMLYSAEFRTSLRHAIRSLSARDRAVLRRYHVDGWTVDRLGEHFGVHRATAADWLARARERLARDVRKDLARRLSLSSSDLESVMRIARSGGQAYVEGMLQ